jgi:hypothetical protein
MCIRGDFACSSNTPHMLAIDVPFGLEQPRVSFMKRESVSRKGAMGTVGERENCSQVTGV